MRAQVLTQCGGAEQFHLAEVDRPIAWRGQVLVCVHATSVNQVDIKIREGLPIGPAMPAILGADLAGVVQAVGADVSDFTPGDEVYGCAGGVKGHGGTLAEFIAADARLLAPKPKSLSFREAAALPLVSITAWEAIERVRVAKSDAVLVHGGTGSVGHVAVQLAHHAGARVSTTVSSDEDFDAVLKLGADHAINYRRETVADYLARITNGRGFDAVIDTVGGQNLLSSFRAQERCAGF